MKRTLITGGAGFIGTNVAHRLLAAGERVLIFDNMSRPGAEQNLQWLVDQYGNRVDVEIADVLDVHSVQRAVANATQIFHFAAQVAVTTSLVDPLEDFLVNARGTLNVLEAMRQQAMPPPLVVTSTNKVYGSLRDIPLHRGRRGYRPLDLALRAHGIDERRPLDFHTPYGCSKGAADQYVLDYARCYGLPTIVFRMSCIYGPHQHGMEDQGWVAHFVIRMLEHKPIILYGDGRQVRDILFVDDLIDALLLAQRHMSSKAGQAFNIGGGPRLAVSLLDVLKLVGAVTGHEPIITFEGWRFGDQRYYVSDTTKFKRATGWRPRVSIDEGIRRLARWVASAGTPVSPPAASHAASTH